MTTGTAHWWTKDTVAVVTGANKGIGYEIVRGLAKEGLTVVLTARDQSRGQAAADALKAEGLDAVWFHQLDVGSPESVKVLGDWLKTKFGGIDILINNAGVIYGPTGQGLAYDNAKAIVGTNFYGTKNVTEGLLPLLRPSPNGARIVSVTSRLGFYNRLKSESILKTFRDEDKYSTEVAESLATKYLEAVKAGKSAEEGWLPSTEGAVQMYSESKMFLNVYAIGLAHSLAKSQPKDAQIYVTTFCPGTTGTDMLQKAIDDGFEAPEGFVTKTVADGADTGIWLALLPKEEIAAKNGKLFGEREEYPFGLENPPF